MGRKESYQTNKLYFIFLSDLDKSLEDKNEEEYLMQRLLDLVNQRSNIVDSIDEDRIR